MFAKRSTIRCQFRRTSDGTSGSGASEFTARPLGSLPQSGNSRANASRLSGVGAVARLSWPNYSGPWSGRSRLRSADAATPEGAPGRRSMRHRPTKVYETLVSVPRCPGGSRWSRRADYQEYVRYAPGLGVRGGHHRRLHRGRGRAGSKENWAVRRSQAMLQGTIARRMSMTDFSRT
jgi:hypothetical protein